MSEPIKKKRLSDEAAERIKQIIIDRELEPGDKLPSERKLMEVFEVGRSAIREALRILENRGMVEVKHGKGTYVTNPNSKIFNSLKSYIYYEQETLQEHFEVRMLIEPHAASMASERSSGEVIDELEETHRKYIDKLESKDKEEIIRIDAKFHLLIAKATKNKTLSVLMETFCTSLLEGWNATLNTPGRANKTVEEHKKILEAIKSNEPEKASKAMKKHLENAIKDLENMGYNK